MAEVDAAGPAGGAAVAGRALTCVVVAGLILAVTALAVGLAGVTEADIVCPTSGAAVADRTLACVVVAGRIAAVTVLAVGLTSMIEVDRSPGAGAVTLAALAAGVVGGLDIRMA